MHDVQDPSKAFILRKKLYGDTTKNDGELEIVSHDLWNLLVRLLSHCPYHIFQNEPVTIESPYEPLILNWDELAKAANETSADETDKQALLDLRLLLDTIASGSGNPRLDKFLKTRDSNRDQRNVSFETLWTIFSHGALIFATPFLGEEQVFIVQGYERTWPSTQAEAPTWTIMCLTYDWDGKFFNRMPLVLSIDHFQGYKPITSLPFYPLDHHPDPASLKKHLFERGQKYREFCIAKRGSRMYDYRGDVVFGKKGFSGVHRDDDEVSLGGPPIAFILIQ